MVVCVQWKASMAQCGMIFTAYKETARMYVYMQVCAQQHINVRNRPQDGSEQ
jgi:hypothetical protein